MIAVRVLPRFPARVEVGAGLAVERAAGVYSFSLDFESLTPATAIADGDTTFIPAWDSEQDAYTRLSANAFGSVMGAGFAGTSSSTVTVGTGEKTFTASVGKSWAAGQRLRIANADDTRVMSGPVTSYDAVSGSLVLDVDYTLGSSSDSTWTIVIGGEVGPTGDDGEGTGDVVGPTGATDGVIALFDGSTGKLLKEGSGAPGALALLDTVATSVIDDEAVTYAKIQDVSATDKLLGRSTAGAGVVEEIACTAAGRALLDDAAASNQRTTLGLGDAATLDLASQGEAEAGTSSTKLMTPERTAEAIAALASGSLAASSQSEMEAGIATDSYVTPGRQQYHKGHPKCAAKVTVSGGTPTLQSGPSYNITSITDTATGRLTITIAADFSSAHWVCAASIQAVSDVTIAGNTSYNSVVLINSQAAGTVVLECVDLGLSTAASSIDLRLADPDAWHMIGIGDQA